MENLTSNREMLTIKYLDGHDIMENDLPAWELLKELAKETMINNSLQALIRYYEYVKQLTTDNFPDIMNPYANHETDENNIYPLGQLTDQLIKTVKTFPKGINVEFGAMIIANNNHIMNEFVMPTIVGINTVDADLLTNKIHRTSHTLDILAFRQGDGENLADKGELGILLNAMPIELSPLEEDVETPTINEFGLPPIQPLTHNIYSTNHNQLFISASELVLPIGKTLADYLTNEVRDEFGISGKEAVENQELRDLLLQSRNTLSTSLRCMHENRWDQYTILQDHKFAKRSFDIDVYGTQTSWHPMNSYYRNALLKNKFSADQIPNGVYWDIHLHNAYTDEEIEEARKNNTATPELLEVVGRDIHIYPTPGDIINTIHAAHQLQDYQGIDTLKIGGAILSLTEEL